MLQLANINKHFMPPGGNIPVPVLTDLSLTVQAGEALAILGPSGSGKSTLLNIIGTLDKPTSGTLHMHGRDLVDLPARELARLRNREIGFIFQLHHLLPQCTVWENIMLPTLAVRKQERPVDAGQHALALLERTGLAARANYLPAQLSGGELQRVAVVRALVNKPGLLLADEPTGSLDNQAAENLAELLLELNREEHVTLLVVTHSHALAGRMQRTLCLHNGKLVPCHA